jgi:hypothetical protein
VLPIRAVARSLRYRNECRSPSPPRRRCFLPLSRLLSAAHPATQARSASQPATNSATNLVEARRHRLELGSQLVDVYELQGLGIQIEQRAANALDLVHPVLSSPVRGPHLDPPQAPQKQQQSAAIRSSSSQQQSAAVSSSSS